MGITREESNVFAKLMLDNPIRLYQLRGNGDFGYYGDRLNNLGEFIILKRCTPTSNNQKKVLWEQSQFKLLDAHPSFKYKTHIANYLYKQINTILANNQSNHLTGNDKIDAILTSDKYQNYIQNEPIQLTTYINNEQQISISSSGTRHAGYEKVRFYTKQELLGLIENLRVTANATESCKIHRPYTNKKFVEEHYDEYEQLYKTYLEDYNQLRQLWDWKIKGDGLHMGLTDDDIYKKVLKPIEFRLEAFNGKYKLIYQMRRMVLGIENHLELLNSPDVVQGYSFVHVYL